MHKGYIIILFLSLGNFALAQTSQPKGVLDLRNHDFSAQPQLNLDGVWEFYWAELFLPEDLSKDPEPTSFVTLPSLWSQQERPSMGVATYHMKVLLPEDPPALSLRVPDFYSSYTLYVNGESFSSNGIPAQTKEDYRPAWLTLTKSLEGYGLDTLDLVLQVANFDHSKGGVGQHIELGTEASINRDREFELAFSYILSGALLMAGLFFLGLFAFGRNDRSILYFALFCLTYIYRIIGFGSYPLHHLIPETPWIITLRLEYLTLFISVFLFGLYTYHLYPNEAKKRVIDVLSAVSILFAVIALFFPPAVFTQLITPYFLIITVYIFYAFYIYWKGWVNQRPGSSFALASTGVALLVFLYQILVYFGYSENYLMVPFAGYLLFVFLQSLILSFRFFNSLKEAREAAVMASRAKSEFLSTMSHEIRTPLNAVIGLSGLLNTANLNDEEQDYLKTIQLSGENLLSVINNVLDYSKIESGHLELEEMEVNLRILVEDVLELLSTLASEKGLELIYQMDDNVPDIVLCDQTRLQQVLLNLVGNAIKFTNHGSVVIRIKRNYLAEFTGNIFISVEDTGIGIPEDRFERLFKSFSQVDASSTRMFGGTGLGLVISKKIIEAMGGDIQVASKEGEGTTFSFTIRAKELDQEPGHQLGIRSLEGLSVVIVDDNKINLTILEHQCVKGGLSVTSISSAKNLFQNLKLLDSAELCILDMQMPEFNGIQLAEEIRKYYSKKDLKLILLSSINDHLSSDEKELFDLILSKPVRQSQLLVSLASTIKNTASSMSTDPEANSDSKKDFSAQEGLKVLIAEDNFINQTVAVKILQKIGYEADVANDGEEAVAKALQESYDLILMDMEMPVMDGIEATRKIRENEDSASSNAIIIALTANVMVEDRDRCIQAGMNDFLTKPMTTQVTADKIAQHFKA